jgi:hypothetical protein
MSDSIRHGIEKMTNWCNFVRGRYSKVVNEDSK